MTHSEDDQADMELAMDLSRALGLLGDEDRTVVWLHDVEGYQHEEIAQMFGKTESFSKTRLNRARAKLRHLMGEMEAPMPGKVGLNPELNAIV